MRAPEAKIARMTDQADDLKLDQPATYRIRVQGRLDASWADWLNVISIKVTRKASHSPVTTLTGEVADQPALYGLLAHLRDLGLPLLLVQWRRKKR